LKPVCKSSTTSATARQNLAEDARFRTNVDRVDNREALIGILEALFKTKTTQQWVDILEAAGIPNAPVNTIADLVNDPQVAHRNMIPTIPHPTVAGLRAPASPLKLSDGPSSIRLPPPENGEHTEAVQLELGYAQDEIANLEAAGAIKRMRIE
ncbi:MAG: CoA transferase, partial [bacterium]|nr:CoA transferase [bacterium]